MKIAITGATGSLGGALVARLAELGDVTRIVALSRDEVKSGDLAERWPDLAPLRCMLADVRDEPRLEEVFRGCDAVVHAAALKRITQSVYSPEEIIKTNVLGTVNVVRAATAVGVERVVIVSSDKACEPTNLYGMSKAVAECYAVQSNSYSVPRGTRVSCVRYGNVLGSRGSVVHLWRDQLRRGASPTITDFRMTRFVISLRAAADFVLGALGVMEGGEIFVPLLPAVQIGMLADAVVAEWATRTGVADPKDFARRSACRPVIGLRPGGEKLHEALLSREEPPRARAREGVVTVLPSHHSWRLAWGPFDADETVLDAAYTSDAPGRWLGVEELVGMLQDVP